MFNFQISRLLIMKYSRRVVNRAPSVCEARYPRAQKLVNPYTSWYSKIGESIHLMTGSELKIKSPPRKSLPSLTLPFPFPPQFPSSPAQASAPWLSLPEKFFKNKVSSCLENTLPEYWNLSSPTFHALTSPCLFLNSWISKINIVDHGLPWSD